ncbi:hypothetical protein OKW34_003352 [Paraburkholderia youngii]|uniref:SWIM zinc finger family protein n=1 Tax=Paraburkholderia youngii TaxID=2782701 RepID=UPI003D23C42D
MADYGGWKPYVPVAERRKKAEQLVARAIRAGKTLSPIAPYRGAIAKTFWGKAWCDNLEHYSDYASRLPRGRTYVRNGSVIDLQITTGRIRAQVMGSSLYEIEINVTACPEKQWRALSAECASSVDSMVELLQGKLSAAVMGRICKAGSGLFPTPKDIKLRCNCLDWATMCKHVAAVLYGVGARLDQQPELLFTLRGVDPADLVGSTGGNLSGAGAAPASAKGTRQRGPGPCVRNRYRRGTPCRCSAGPGQAQGSCFANIRHLQVDGAEVDRDRETGTKRQGRVAGREVQSCRAEKAERQNRSRRVEGDTLGWIPKVPCTWVRDTETPETPRVISGPARPPLIC